MEKLTVARENNEKEWNKRFLKKLACWIVFNFEKWEEALSVDLIDGKNEVSFKPLNEEMFGKLREYFETNFFHNTGKYRHCKGNSFQKKEENFFKMKVADFNDLAQEIHFSKENKNGNITKETFLYILLFRKNKELFQKVINNRDVSESDKTNFLKNLGVKKITLASFIKHQQNLIEALSKAEIKLENNNFDTLNNTRNSLTTTTGIKQFRKSGSA
jgi:hypothetical protein